MNNLAKNIIVYGFVQGVGFRFFTKRIAMEYEFKGYAKNNFDGTVEILITGDLQKFDSFISELKIGPNRAKVEKLNIFDIEINKKYESFEIF